MKTLSTLINLSEKKLEDQQILLSKLQKELQNLQETRENLKKTAQKGFNSAAQTSTDATIYKSAGSYANFAKHKDEELGLVEQLLRNKIAEETTKLKTLFTEKKRLEIIYENKAKAAKKAAARKEQMQLDEISNRPKT